MKTNSQKCLRTYPIEWPIFSTKNYKIDEEGWWNFSRKKRVRRRLLLMTENDDILADEELTTVPRPTEINKK